MRVKSRHLLLMLVLSAVIWAGHAARAEENIDIDRKYPLISAYIYNFTQFTVWPESAVKSTFTVCVVGRDPFGSFLNPIQSKEVKGSRISIKRYNNGKEGALSACNVLFIAGSESDNIASILAPLRGTPVLTMSDIEGFADAGGMVEFKPESGKIGIWIDLATVKTAGIAISSKLLSLVHIKE
jgi:hypothetical protein